MKENSIKNTFYLLGAIVKNKPFVLLFIFITFLILGSIIILSISYFHLHPINAKDINNGQYPFAISLAILVFSIITYCTLSLSSAIAIGKILIESQTSSVFTQRVQSLNLKSFFLKPLAISLGHIISLILFFLFIISAYRLIEFNAFILVPSLGLTFLFIYAYVRVLEQVITSRTFSESFMAIIYVIKPSMLASLFTIKYFMSFIFFLFFLVLMLMIPSPELSYDSTTTEVLLSSIESAFYEIISILLLPFFAVWTKGSIKQTFGHMVNVFITLFVFTIIGFASYITWQKHELRTFMEEGDMYSEIKVHDEAIASYQKALNIDPLNDEAHCSMAFEYTMKKEYVKAMKYYNKYLEINPLSDNCYAYEGLLELQLIQGLGFDAKIEKKCIELYQDEDEYFITYEMLKIMEKLSKGEKVDLKSWNRKYKNIKSEWDFDEIREWVKKMPGSEKKQKLLDAVRFFEEHDSLTEGEA